MINLLDETKRIFETGQCPGCQSHQTKVQQTRKPIRRHICLECGFIWKSVMIYLHEEDAIIKAAELQKNKKIYEEILPFL